jgi:hypothetical protein
MDFSPLVPVKFKEVFFRFADRRPLSQKKTHKKSNAGDADNT